MSFFLGRQFYRSTLYIYIYIERERDTRYDGYHAVKILQKKNNTDISLYLPNIKLLIKLLIKLYYIIL